MGWGVISSRAFRSLQVVTFPGPEHHAMLAQSYWFGVTISGGMSYGEEAHL